MRKLLLFFILFINIAASAQNLENRKQPISDLLQKPMKTQWIYDRNPYAPQYLDSIVSREPNGALSSKMVFDYTKGYVSLIADYSWDSTTQRWLAGTKTEYEYNKSDSLTFYASYMWDSKVNDWYCTYKVVEAFDESDRKTLTVNYIWDSTLNKLIGTQKTTHQYDSKGNEILYSLYDWHYAQDDWIEVYRIQHDYNNNLLMKETNLWWDEYTGELSSGSAYEYSYNGTNIDFCVRNRWDNKEKVWKISSKEDYIYSNGRVSEKIHSWWSSSEKNWSASSREEYAYNSDGRLIREDRYSVSDGNMVGRFISRMQYDYDSNGHMILKFLRFYDSDTNTWDTSFRYEYAFDNAGRNISTVMYSWHSGVITRPGSSKTERRYDENGNITLYIHYEWDEGVYDWVGETKYVNTYEDYNQLQASQDSYKWDTAKNDWVRIAWSTDKYDKRGNSTAWEHNYWDNVSGDLLMSYKGKTEYAYNTYGNPDTATNYDWEGNKYTFNSTSKYYYGDGSGGGSGIDKIQQSLVQVYPNPASDYISFILPDNPDRDALIIISDMNGRICLRSEITDRRSLYVGDLKPGIYLYQIKNKNNSHHGKLIIK